MEKNELIKKVKKINDIYCESQSVLYEIENVSVEDNYERKIKVPSEPNCPTEVFKPTKYYRSKGDLISLEDYFKKLPIGFGIASVVQVGVYFAAKSGIDGSGDSADQIQTGFTNFTKIVLFILIGVCALFLVINLLKVFKALLGYSSYVDSVDRKYNDDLAKYNKYVQEKDIYNKKLENYNEILKQHEDEEESISSKIEEEETKLANSIRAKKYNPLIEKLEKENDGIIGDIYYPDLSLIIDLLESGRADSIKEAINLVEDIKFKERQLDLEREKMEREAADREEAARAEEELYREDRWREERQREEDRRREDSLRREQESRDHQAALRQCSNCANIRGCRNYAKYPNCPNYRHN